MRGLVAGTHGDRPRPALSTMPSNAPVPSLVRRRACLSDKMLKAELDWRSPDCVE